MPIRIKPDFDLGPCILNLESIKGIVALVHKDFPSASYSAHDGIWEIYQEPNNALLDAISQKERLDSFVINAEDTSQARRLEIVFDDTQARVSLIAAPGDYNWFEHFIIDLKKHILRPSLFQSVSRGNRVYIGLPSLLLFGGFDVPVGRAPYCRIILRAKPPNPFVENIKANLVSSLIWALLGAGAVLVLQLMRGLL